MKKQWIAWGLISVMISGTVLENYGTIWAFDKEVSNNRYAATSSNANMEELPWGDISQYATPSDVEYGEISYATESDAKLKEISYATGSNMDLQKKFLCEDGVIISLDLQDMILPEDTDIQIKTVEVPEEARKKLKLAIKESGKELSDIYAYDITFWSEDEKIEVGDGAQITFEFSESVTGEQLENSELFCFKNKRVTVVDKQIENNNEISCYMEGKSVYGVALAQEDDYIPIYTAEDLQNIQNDLSSNYKLMNDIDMSGFVWKPIGGDTKQKLRGFKGTLDGQNFSISNLNLKEGKKYKDPGINIGYGIFTELPGTVKNLKITNSVLELDDDYINADEVSSINAGLLAASLVGGTIENCVVQDCEICLRTTLEIQSMSVGTLTGNDSGISTIKKCRVNNSTLKGSTYSRLILGGIAGSVYEINDSIFAGTINVVSTGNYSWSSYVGGITGIAGNQIESCANFGDVTGTASYGIITGGITGRASAMVLPVSMCANDGTVYADSRMARGVAGGIVGELDSSSVENSYNAGNVRVAAGYAGGIIGYNRQGTGSISCCYNIGTIEKEANDKNSYAGDITGYSTGGAFDKKIEKCYYINIGIGNRNNNELTDKLAKATFSEMEEQSTFDGFDFDSIWVMGEETYPYPVLQWQGEANGDIDVDVPDETKPLYITYASVEKENVYTDSDIVLKFNKPVQIGGDFLSDGTNDTFQIKEYITGDSYYAWNATTAQYEVDGNVFTLKNALQDLSEGILYYLYIPAGFFVSNDESIEPCTGREKFNFVIQVDDMRIIKFVYTINGETFTKVRAVHEGEICKEPEDPEWDGYIFAGWYTAKNFDPLSKFDFSKKIKENVILYGKFVLIQQNKDDKDNPDKVSDHDDPYKMKNKDSGFTNCGSINGNVIWRAYKDGEPLVGYQNDLWYNGVKGNFLFDENGIMLTGWHSVDGRLRYFDETPGHRGFEITPSDLAERLKKNSAYKEIAKYDDAAEFAKNMGFVDATEYLIVNYDDVSSMIKKWFVTGKNPIDKNEDWAQSYLKEIINGICNTDVHKTELYLNDNPLFTNPSQKNTSAYSSIAFDAMKDLIKGTEYASVEELFEYVKKAAKCSAETVDVILTNYASNVELLDRYENICPELKDVIENIKAEYRNAVRIDLKKASIDKITKELNLENLNAAYEAISSNAGQTEKVYDLAKASAELDETYNRMVEKMFKKTLAEVTKDFTTVSEVEKVIQSAYMRGRSLEALKRAEEKFIANPNSYSAQTDYFAAYEIAREATKIQYDAMFSYYNLNGSKKKAEELFDKYQELVQKSAMNY